MMPLCAYMMPKMGTVIHIHRPPEIIYADLAKDGGEKFVWHCRNDGSEIGMREKAVQVYVKEIPHYKKLANLTLENTGTEDEAFEKLIALISGTFEQQPRT